MNRAQAWAGWLSWLTALAERTWARKVVDAGKTLRSSSRCLRGGTALIVLLYASLPAMPQELSPPRSPVEQTSAGPFNPFDAFASSQAVMPAEFSSQDVLNTPLAEVVVEGNRTILLNAIMSKIDSRPGRPPNPRVIQEDVARLLTTHWFLSVRPSYRVTEKGPVLVFEVVERPILRSVTFVGNKKVKTGELEAHTGLRKGHGFDVAANQAAVQRIKSLYREKGYLFAKVELEKGGDPDDRDVVIRIDEGKKVRVQGIQFEGNEFVTDAVLRTKLSTKAAILWIIGGTYDKQLVQNDVFGLKQYYMGLGFFDVEVEAEEQISEEDGEVIVRFLINEGTRYKLGNIDFVGNEVVSTEELTSSQKLEEGDYFNARFLRQDVESMKGAYDELGRIFARVEPVPQFRQDEPGWVDMVYRIDEDVPRYIGTINIHIRGDHPHTQETVVRNQITRYAKPGQLASGKLLRLAESRVRGSALWDRTDPVEFNVVPVNGADYLPPASIARGQNLDRDGLLETTDVSSIQPMAADTQPQWLQPDPPVGPATPVFGHSLVPERLQRATARPVFGVHEPPIRPADSAQQHDSGRPAPARGAQLPLIRPTTQLPRPQGPVGRASMTDRTAAEGARYNIDPDVIFRGQSPPPLLPPPVYRGQSIDRFGNPVPQNYLQEVSPQGDPFGDALRRAPPGFVDINVDVTEGRTGRLMFGVGVNSNAGVLGSLSFQEDNFDILRPPRSWADIINGQAWRGAGQSFRLEAVPGYQVSRYLASWQDPYFLGTDFSLSVSGFYYNRFFNEWTEQRVGGRIGLGYLLDQFWSLGAALRLEGIDVQNFQRPAPIDLERVADGNFLSTGQFTATYDTRDSAFIPSLGHILEFTYEQAFGEFNYPRLELAGGQYFTLYERPDGFGKHVLHFSGQLGWTGDNTPIFERFFAGGFGSFRGFQFRGVSPRSLNVRVGGNWMALGTAEYIYPITASDSVRGVFFTDFGTVQEDVSLSQIRVTAGFGFRLLIPAMGPAPLAFDFAWPVVQEPADNLQVFSFTIGFTR